MPLIPFLFTLVLSAFTGWFTIWLVLKLLFRPARPLSFAGFTIQGVLPANQQLIAEKIGDMVSAELLSFKILQEKAADPENFNKLKPEIEKHIDSFLRERLKETFPMLSMLIGGKTINQLKTAFIIELETLFPVLMTNYIGNLEKDINIKKLVTDKITSISLAQTEQSVYKLARKKIIKVQLMGAFIGLLIGFIHILINTQFYS